MPARRHGQSSSARTMPEPGALRSDLADALLCFLSAPARDREEMVQDARRALATAGLHRAVLQEALGERVLDELNGFPELRSELAAARERVVESAELLLGLRATAATIAFVM